MYPHNAVTITAIANGYLVMLPESIGYAVAQPLKRKLFDRVLDTPEPEFDLADKKQTNIFMFAELPDALEFIKTTLTK